MKIVRTIFADICCQSTADKEITNNELGTETGQSISPEMKTMRLRWAGIIAQRKPLGNF